MIKFELLKKSIFVRNDDDQGFQNQERFVRISILNETSMIRIKQALKDIF